MKNEFENNDPLNSPDFGLPAGYFQKSADSVVNKIDWLEEHKQLPVLLSLQNTNAFKIPLNYFIGSEQSLALLDYPILKILAKENGFSTPKNYFEESESLELSKVIGDSEDILQKIPKRNNFKVQPDYFGENAQRLEEKVLKRDIKIISLLRSASLITAAALLIVALSFWMYNTYFIPVEIKDCGTIACIDKADLLKTNNLENLDNEELYELVNTKELEENLGEGDSKNKLDKLTDSLIKANEDYLLDEI